MGSATFAREAYDRAYTDWVPRQGPATSRGHETVRTTGKLDPLVDPAEFGLIRRSLPRFDLLESGMQQLTIGMPMAAETRLDTTGSMGRNVEVALRVLPDTFDLCAGVLPGFDLQMAIGIFGDYQDQFILCRPQFEMEADKIVHQLTLMVPEHGGAGNGGEDPHYGLFGAAYLTDARINRYGLKCYDFTISDEPARTLFNENLLIRVFGDTVFDKVAENGHEISRADLPTTNEVVQALLKRAHAFFLEVPSHHSTHEFWTDAFGHERVVVLPSVELLPQVQAVIIGLTEGVLELGTVSDYLEQNGVSARSADAITRSVANIPIGAQVPLREGLTLPVKGDVFREKTDLWPVDPSEVGDVTPVGASASPEGPNWL